MKKNSSQTSKKKAELFNHIFLNQCSLLSDNSTLPTVLNQLTNKRLDSIHFSSSDITKIISHLDPNKAHGHNTVSIHMIKHKTMCELNLQTSFNNFR